MKLFCVCVCVGACVCVSGVVDGVQWREILV